MTFRQKCTDEYMRIGDLIGNCAMLITHRVCSGCSGFFSPSKNTVQVIVVGPCIIPVMGHLLLKFPPLAPERSFKTPIK